MYPDAPFTLAVGVQQGALNVQHWIRSHILLSRCAKKSPAGWYEKDDSFGKDLCDMGETTGSHLAKHLQTPSKLHISPLCSFNWEHRMSSSNMHELLIVTII